MSARRFTVSSSPHIHSPQKVNRIMLDVCLALLPAAIFGVVRFGLSSALVMLSSIAGTVLTEWVGNKILKKPVSITDGSAAVTGLLIGMCCPAYVPLWLPFVGGVFAVAIVKLPFGGLGHNFLNPALTARAFLLASWPNFMTQWKPAEVISKATDAISSATPLAAHKLGAKANYSDLFLGNIDGCIGEVCKWALLIGALYLLVRWVITLYTPVGYLVGLYVFCWIFGSNAGLFTGDGLFAILSGGAMLGALFMCNDYVTSPITGKGQFLMGLGAGALTGLIRLFGSYVEGVTYAILFMNVLTPLIDRFVRPKAFGEAEKRALLLEGKKR